MQANDKTETMLDAMQGETTAVDVLTADEAMENRSLLFETEPETGDGEGDNAPVRPKRVRKKPVTEPVSQESISAVDGGPEAMDLHQEDDDSISVSHSAENGQSDEHAGPEGALLSSLPESVSNTEEISGTDLTSSTVNSAETEDTASVLQIEESPAAGLAPYGQEGSEPVSVPHESLPDELEAVGTGSRRRIVTLHGERSELTAQAKRRQALIDLSESRRSGRVLTGMIMGMEGNGRNPLLTYAVIHYGAFKVIIPVSEMLEPSEETEQTAVEDYRVAYVSHRMGAEIDYVVTEIDEANNLAVGSRLAAMRQRRRDFFMRRSRDGRYLLEEGDIAEARVVSVLQTGAFVELFGVEQFIPTEELSHMRVAAASMHLKVGQKLLVKILELNRSGRDAVQLSLSAKQAEAERQLDLITRYTIGELYVGRVTMIAPVGVFVALSDEVTCLCQFSKRGRPAMHATVTVKLLGIDQQRLQLWGALVHF